eukprot:jgi/Tetstr1/447984/TSEL_035288.t1
MLEWSPEQGGVAGYLNEAITQAYTEAVKVHRGTAELFALLRKHVVPRYARRGDDGREAPPFAGLTYRLVPARCSSAC